LPAGKRELNPGVHLLEEDLVARGDFGLNLLHDETSQEMVTPDAGVLATVTPFARGTGAIRAWRIPSATGNSPGWPPDSGGHPVAGNLTTRARVSTGGRRRRSRPGRRRRGPRAAWPR